MALIDAFAGSAFKQSTLGDAIRVVPNMYGRVGELRLARTRAVPTTTVQIEFKNGVLNLLPFSTRGAGGGTVGRSPKREMKTFSLLHIEHDEFIYADDIQDVRAYAQEHQQQALTELTNDKLETMAGKFDITEEWHLSNMIQGRIIDADGTVVFNAFTDFGVTRREIDFDLGNANSDVDKHCVDIVRHMEDNALGEPVQGAHVLVDEAFFDAFIKHPVIRDAYKFYASVQEPLRDDVRRSFTHKGVTFEEYRGKATALNSDDSTTTRRFIPAGEGAAFPLGTSQAFQQYYGPADFVSAANKPGQRLVVRLLADPSGKDKFVGMHGQMNPFYLCTRPALLVRVFSST